MAILPILVAPDPRLKRTAQPVAEVNDEIRQIMADMLETMYAAPGIGLAAIQVGIDKQIIVIDLGRPGVEEPEDSEARRGFYPSRPYKIANPEIVWASDELATCEEGCLSVPGEFDIVERPAQVHVKYLDENNQEQIMKADGLLAACIQHEMDHLNGTLFVDHLSRLKRDRAINGLRKAKASGKLKVDYQIL